MTTRAAAQMRSSMPTAQHAPPTIRSAKPDEASTLSALARRAIATWEDDQASMQDVQAEWMYILAHLFQPGVIVEVAETAHHLVRFYILKMPEKRIAFLQALFVDPPVIRQGIGRA